MPTARDLARDEMNRRILELGRQQLAEVGAAGLSVRALTRELGVSSSAVYRYVSSRDDLLTRLIVDGYDELGAITEDAIAGRARPVARWRRATTALRDWAETNPQRWMLLYGTPVPDYQAPEETIAPAGRAAAALLDILADPRVRVPRTASRPPRPLLRNLARAAGQFQTDLEPTTLLLGLTAYARLVGTLTLELGGHLVGTAEPAEAYWSWMVDELAHELGITS